MASADLPAIDLGLFQSTWTRLMGRNHPIDTICKNERDHRPW